MSLLLIDTDITSFIFKGRNYADPYLPLLIDQELALSFMTVAELFNQGPQNLWFYLEGYLSPLSATVITPTDIE